MRGKPLPHDGSRLADDGRFRRNGVHRLGLLVHYRARKTEPFVQHGVNLAGAALLTISLLYHLNLASLVLEGFWASIAIWGLWKAFRKRKLA